MSQMTDADRYLEKLLIDEYMIKKNTARFFTYLLDLFSITETITSSSKKLGESYVCHERTIRNYLKELDDNNLIHRRPHRNQDDPNKKYIEYTVYSKTRRTDEVINKVKYFKKLQSDVFFVRKDKQSQINHRRY